MDAVSTATPASSSLLNPHVTAPPLNLLKVFSESEPGLRDFLIQNANIYKMIWKLVKAAVVASQKIFDCPVEDIIFGPTLLDPGKDKPMVGIGVRQQQSQTAGTGLEWTKRRYPKDDLVSWKLDMSDVLSRALKNNPSLMKSIRDMIGALEHYCKQKGYPVKNITESATQSIILTRDKQFIIVPINVYGVIADQLPTIDPTSAQAQRAITQAEKCAEASQLTEDEEKEAVENRLAELEGRETDEVPLAVQPIRKSEVA